MYQTGKKILAMLLALCMVAGVLPLTAQAALLEGENYITQQLYLGEDLVLHLRGDIPEAYQGATAVITFCGESKSTTISDLTQDENGLYDMAVTVDVAEMTENISLVAKYLGMTAIEENYSVAAYLKSLISGNYTRETKFLALELLNFGAAAQNYFDYNTGNLANAGYENAPSNAIPDEIPAVVQSGRVDGISFYGTSVRFLSKTAVRFYFAADSVAGLTFTVDGTQYTPSSNENGYFIEVSGINPQDMDEEMVVSVTNGTDTLTVNYAPINYFVRTYHNTENEEMKTLAATAYSYFVAASKFVGVVPTGDFTEGVNFETAGNEQLFSGVGGENEWRDALIERIAYADTSISAPANGGEYAMMLTCASSQWPVFRMNFGKTLKAGTTITFDAYTNDTSGIRETVSIFEYVSGGDATVQYYHGTWNTLTITLASDCDHIDLMCNMDRWNEPGPANLEIYLDNFFAVEPAEPAGDFLEGVDFETVGNAERFTGTGVSQDATIRRVTYAAAGVAAPENGGDYALQVSHANNCWPTFRMNFGKTLKAGTTITFDVYGDYEYEAAEGVTKYMKLELSADSKNVAASEDPNQVLWTVVETWRTDIAITLTADCDHIDFFYNVADGQHGNVYSWLLMDNFKAVEPIDITEGFDFDNANQAGAFEALTEGVMFEVTSVDSNNVLKVSHASECWPNFRVNFGKTLKAGTTITFDVYGNYDYAAAEGVTKYMKLELTGDSKNFATSADPNQLVWTVVETWRTDIAITLTADSDYVDLFYNVADGQHGNVSSWIYMDNFKAVEPILISEGLNFDNADEVGAFEALTEGVTFETTSVDGNNVLKASHASNCWPNFRVNFGKTLKAGTTITFDFYGNYDYVAPEGGYKYLKLELTSDSKAYATSADPNQVIWTLAEKWAEAAITLTADSDHLDLFYNVADGQHGDPIASWIYMDNFKAIDPVLISNGLTFDNSRDAELFTGIEGQEWRNAATEVISFDGDNVLKLSCSSSAWPTFRINFGQTLKAGTVITFDAYGNYDYEAAEGVTKYIKLELTGDSKNVATTEDPNQVLWTVVETWRTGITITLTADCDHIDFYYNVADGQHGETPASWILLDDFKVEEPA